MVVNNIALRVIIVSILIIESFAVKKDYISLNHATVLYYDKTVLANLTVTARRVSRSDKIHYISVFYELLTRIEQNTLQIDFYFFETVSMKNYKLPDFELHIEVCDLIINNPLIGRAVQEAFDKMSVKPSKYLRCPIVPGRYEFKNMIFMSSALPKQFVYHTGRLYINGTWHNKKIFSGYIDVEL